MVLEVFTDLMSGRQTPTVKIIHKQLRSNLDVETFKRERDCLTRLHKLHHHKIVDLLCSYTYNKEHSLLFPRKAMDLEVFLQREERYEHF